MLEVIMKTGFGYLEILLTLIGCGAPDELPSMFQVFTTSSGENIANKIKNEETMSQHTNTMIKVIAITLENQLNEELVQPGSLYY
jgi:hypothetical protein